MAKGMRVWLVTIGEPVPTSSDFKDRPHRTGILARHLSNRGNEVVWWTSTFNHFSKRHYFEKNTTIQMATNFAIRFLHGFGYRRNISIMRFADHLQLARIFAQQARQEAQLPDIIVSSYPGVWLSLEAVKFGLERSLPVIVDMRDMWPDIIIDHIPSPLNFLAKYALLPYFRAARNACAHATAITGITDAFVEWGVEKGKRQKTELDRSFPLGYITTQPAESDIREGYHYWEQYGIVPGGADIIVVFIGSLGYQFQLDTLFRTSRILRAKGKRIKFVLGGTGERLDDFRAQGENDDLIIIPGWINAAQIYTLLRCASIGLDPLPDRYDFLATINNKAIEYLSAGLPIISCPEKGILAQLLKQEGIGFSYAYGDENHLAETLLKLDQDRELLRQVSERAKVVFEEQFTADRVYTMMESHLRTVRESYSKAHPVND